jgi:Tfp pilus tip-associated adhesin PilY1
MRNQSTLASGSLPLRRARFAPAFVLGTALCTAPALAQGPGADSDSDLFRTNVPPNVLMIVDNSKSMNDTVWHPDYGLADGSGNLYKNQTECTHFRDMQVAFGNSANGPIRVYPGGRQVNYINNRDYAIRTRGASPQAWEPAVIDVGGNHVFNDADNDGVQDAGEWLAYHRTCDPNNNTDYNICLGYADADGDGIPGRTVLDAFGNPLVDAGTGRTFIYKTSGTGTNVVVKVRTTITPREVVAAAGINPATYAFFTNDICGVDPSGWSLWSGDSGATTPNGFTITLQPQYLDFLFSSLGAAARAAAFTPTALNDGVRTKSACVDLEPLEAPTFETYRRTRLMALRLILRTVTCELEEDVRFGIAQFRFHGLIGDDNGGYVALPVNSRLDASGNPITYTLHGISDTHENHLARVIRAVGPDAQTPLNETLFQAYTYFMSRDPAELPPGRDANGDPVVGVGFPVYAYNMDLHNPLPDDNGDLNMVGGHYVGNAVTTTHPKPLAASNLNADGLDPLGNGGLAPFPAWDSSAAPDPVQYACQKNFMLMITDGGSSGDIFDDRDVAVNASFSPPTDIETGTDQGFADFDTLIGDHYRNPDGTADEVERPGGTRTNYLDDISYFMNRWDFRPDLDGDQTIDTYTVGYSVDTSTDSNVELAAVRGNGLFFESGDADELSADIVAAFTDIIEKSQSFTSATVPASRTTDGDNFYSSFFLPKDDSPFWDGHLKNFEFTAAGDVLTADGFCATGTNTAATPPCVTNGRLRTESNAFWDAAEEIPAPASRNLFTGDGALAFGDQAKDWTEANIDLDDLKLPIVTLLSTSSFLGAPYSMTDPADATEQELLTDRLVSTLAGCNFGTLISDSSCVTRTNDDGTVSLLGDIFHSNPIVVGSPNAPINEATYHAFANSYRTRDRVIYAGSNDGFLHGFHAGDWQTLEADGVTPLAPPRHDRGTGAELMAFMPSQVRDQIWRLPISQASGGGRSFTGVDGSPVVADAWIYRNIDGSGNLSTELSPPVSTTKDARQWRTVLIAGLRGGGQGYYALDITNPASSNYPGYLWEFPCDDCANAVNPSTLSDEANYLGFTWSEPVIARVKVHVEGTTAGSGQERWVAIFGAGYHQFGDPNHVNYVEDGDPDPATDLLLGNLNRAQGRAIYMVDITNGQVLAKKHWSATATSDGSGQVGYPEMRYAFASAPAVFDLDFDSFADVIYVPDLGGNVWKWAISAVGDDPIHNSTADDSLGQPDWPFKIFFTANHSTSPSPASYGVSHFQNFFFPPTGVLRKGVLNLAIGAGERISPEAGLDDSDPLNNNHLFVLRDKDPREENATPLATLTEADLYTDAAIDAGTYSCTQVEAGNGFFLTARDREKFITNSVIFLGYVLTGSFVPAASGADPCSDTGDSYLYAFSVDCGTPKWPGNSGSGNNDRRRLIGDGLPTRPRVSVGAINQGGSSGGCDNKVVVITSDGQIDNDCPGNMPSSGVDLRSWRER